MELCGWCKKRDGVHQLYGMSSDGEKYPTRKLCDDCWIAFKTPSKKLQKILKRDGIEVNVPIKPTCVMSRNGQVVTCDTVTLTEWLCAGWTVIGIADTSEDLKRLQSVAREVRP